MKDDDMDNAMRWTTNKSDPHQKLILEGTYTDFSKTILKDSVEIKLLWKATCSCTLQTIIHNFTI